MKALNEDKKEELKQPSHPINKFSAISRHQNLKPETHDFLLSLVKKGNTNPANLHVGNAYKNCFNSNANNRSSTTALGHSPSQKNADLLE